MGANFYRDLSNPHRPGTHWPAFFPPPARRALALARAHRFAFVTAEYDFNRVEVRNVHQAYVYNPFGLVFVPLIVCLGVVGLLPRRYRDGFRGRLERWTWLVQVAGATLIVTFLALGWVRWYCVVRGVGLAHELIGFWRG